MLSFRLNLTKWIFGQHLIRDMNMNNVRKLAFQYERAYVRELSSIEEEVLHCDEFDSHDLYESREYYRNNWLIIYQRRNLEKNE